MSKAVFEALAENNLWSNHRLHRACAGLSEGAYFQERPSFFGTIHATLTHILETDLRYLNRMKGLDADAPTPIGPDPVDLTGMTKAQERQDRALLAFCRALGGEELASEITWYNSEGTRTCDPLGSMLLHLFQHQIHHRGQVHALLTQTDVAPPQLDEFFLSMDLPLREAELRHLGLPG
ncbi:MAG: DinB family protein [Rhodospirillales bacterium]|nr:DinB family protein [Rhodospirillales bacterium]